MKFYFNVVIITMSTLHSCYSDTEIHGKYFGRGVCSVSLRDEKKVPVKMIRFHNETTWEWCWNLPPWCTVVSREWFDYSPSLINIPHEHLKLKCCPGYRSNSAATACIPICSPLCIKGHCREVDTCSLCTSDGSGPKCDSKLGVLLTRIRSKESLLSKCQCLDDNFICTSNGTCVCAPGFNGTDCTTIIEPSSFIVNPGEKPSCVAVYMQVIGLLSLLVLSCFLVIHYIKRYFNIVRFEPLIDYSEPCTSRHQVP